LFTFEVTVTGTETGAVTEAAVTIAIFNP
jgi:hypothetical protein